MLYAIDLLLQLPFEIIEKTVLICPAHTGRLFLLLHASVYLSKEVLCCMFGDRRIGEIDIFRFLLASATGLCVRGISCMFLYLIFLSFIFFFFYEA